MEEVKIKALMRKERGTSRAKALRRQNFIPAIVYGRVVNLTLKIDKKELKYLKQHHFSENIIINLEITNGANPEIIPVLLKDYQSNPLTEEVIHLDFIKVSMEEKVTVEVPVEVKGEAKGLKLGGSLDHPLWKIEVECLPKDIPESITVDVSDLDIGHSIHVEDLEVPEGVEILTDSKEVVVTITAPVKEEEIIEEAEVIKEPEVVKEKPKEEVEEEPREEKSKEKSKEK